MNLWCLTWLVELIPTFPMYWFISTHKPISGSKADTWKGDFSGNAALFGALGTFTFLMPFKPKISKFICKYYSIKNSISLQYYKKVAEFNGLPWPPYCWGSLNLEHAFALSLGTFKNTIYIKCIYAVRICYWYFFPNTFTKDYTGKLF